MLVFIAASLLGGKTGGGGGGGGGVGGGGGNVPVDIVCVEGEKATGNSSMIDKKATPLGAIGCVDPDAIAYRRTLPESIAGPGDDVGNTDGLATINIFGLFENGFDSNVPDFSCLGSNTVYLT